MPGGLEKESMNLLKRIGDFLNPKTTSPAAPKEANLEPSPAAIGECMKISDQDARGFIQLLLSALPPIYLEDAVENLESDGLQGDKNEFGRDLIGSIVFGPGRGALRFLVRTMCQYGELRDRALVQYLWNNAEDHLTSVDAFTFENIDIEKAEALLRRAADVAGGWESLQNTEFMELFPWDGPLGPYLDSELAALRTIDNDAIKAAIERHQSVLIGEITKEIALNTDKYGKVDFQPVMDEIRLFGRSSGVLDQLKSYTELGFCSAVLDALLNAAEVDDTDTAATHHFHEEPPFDPTHFEAWCLNQAKLQGLSGYLTPRGADQGIDVVIEVDDIRLGLQCKRVSRPCGNEAVQQVIAGCGYYNLQVPAVVSTAGFTRAAQNLGKKCNVTLLSPRDLSAFLRKIRNSPEAEAFEEG